MMQQGTDLGMESAELTRGYTHAFESTFESLAGLQEYLDSPALAAFAKDFFAYIVTATCDRLLSLLNFQG